MSQVAFGNGPSTMLWALGGKLGAGTASTLKQTDRFVFQKTWSHRLSARAWRVRSGIPDRRVVHGRVPPITVPAKH